MKRSKWFPVERDPDLVGVYEWKLKSNGQIFKAKFEGDGWWVLYVKGEQVRPNSNISVDDQWRGLAEKPE